MASSLQSLPGPAQRHPTKASILMQNDRHNIDPELLRAWMANYICGVLGLDRATFSAAARFDTYGLDSVEAVIMAGVMEEEFQVIVDPTVFFDAPSVDEFVALFTSGAAVG
jgi:acyl carrier protein